MALVGSINAPNDFGFKNRIINGAMVIDQRNAGASVTPTTTNTYTLDRWSAYLSQSSKYSVQQKNGVDSGASNYEAGSTPAGFRNSLKVTSLSAYSVGASEFFSMLQTTEGLNVSDLGWGAAGASTVTLSFWVKSSLTGSFGGAVQSWSGDANYPFSYTISSANTWQQVSITIPGPTFGTFATNNTQSFAVGFCLGAGATVSGTAGTWSSTIYRSATGATSVVGTNGATFYITGVQLEKGSTATSFDYRPYGTELRLCQRYYEKSYDISTAAGTASVQGYSSSSVGSNTVPAGQAYSQICFAVSKRAAPTVTLYGFQGGSGKVSNWQSGADFAANSGIANSTGTEGFNAYNNSGGTLATSAYAIIYHWTASIEL